MVLQRGRAESLRSRTNDTHSSDSAEVGWSAATPPLGRGSVASRASCRMCCICSLLQLVESREAPALVSCVDPRSNSVFFTWQSSRQLKTNVFLFSPITGACFVEFSQFRLKVPGSAHRLRWVPVVRVFIFLPLI